MKRKIIWSAIALLIISTFISYLMFDKFNVIEITAAALSKEYTSNKELADKKYLNKIILLKGKVKAFYKLLGTRNVLELQVGGGNKPIFCFFFSKRIELEAKTLQQGQQVEIKGKCMGEDDYLFVNGIKVDVIKIEN